MLNRDSHVKTIDVLPANEPILTEQRFKSFAFPLTDYTYYVVGSNDGQLWNNLSAIYTPAYMKQELIQAAHNSIKLTLVEVQNNPDVLALMDDLVKKIVANLRPIEGGVLDIDTVITQVVTNPTDGNLELLENTQIESALDGYMIRAARDLGYYFSRNDPDTLVLKNNKSIMNILPPVDINYKKTLEDRKANTGFYDPLSVGGFKYSQAIINPDQVSESDEAIRLYNRNQELSRLSSSKLRDTYIRSEGYRSLLDELRTSLTDENGQLNSLGQEFINSWK